MTVMTARNESYRGLLCVAAAVGLLMSGWMSDRAQGAAAGALQRKTHTVVIEGTSFQPARLTVSAGDTVVWINRDPFPHTATSTTGVFDSGTIAPDKMWKYKFVKKGALDYICTLHPTMKARLTVE
jgi:plastocyanin